jgi:hypothetical protein
MPAWAGATPKNFSSYWAARSSLSRTHIRCFPIRQGYCVLSRTPKDCVTAQIRAFHAAWKEAGHSSTPRISVSRSIFALIDDRDRAYFGRGVQEQDQIGFLDQTTRAIFGSWLRSGTGY